MTPADELEMLRLRKRKAMAAQAAPPRIQPAPEPSGPDAMRSGVLGFANGGTMGFADEIGGTLGRLLVSKGVHLTPEAQTQAKAQGIEVPADVSSYDLVRDGMRREAAQAKESHGKMYGGGQILGGVAAAAIAPGSGAKSLLQVARTGAGLGAVAGAGDSQADTVGGVAADSALGAGMGAAGSVAGTQLMRSLPTVSRWASDKFREYAASSAKRVLTNGADQLSKKAALTDDVALEAIRSGGVRAFGTTKGAAVRLGTAAEHVGDTYGEMLDRGMSLGARGPVAADVAQTLKDRATSEAFDTMEDRVPEVFREEADRLLTKLRPGENTLGLRQAENLKRTLQNKARFGEFKDTAVNDARKDIASVLRQANEDALDQAGQNAGAGSELAEISANFVPVKQQLGRLLEARGAAERGVAAGAKRTGTPMPGAMEIGTAIASGNPAVLAAKLPGAFIKGRLPSALAVGAYGMSGLLNGAAGGAVRLAGSEGARATAGREGATLAAYISDALRARGLGPGQIADSGELTPEQRATVEALRAQP